jgi:hypothetical protein
MSFTRCALIAVDRGWQNRAVMTSHRSRYHYSVVRDLGGPARADVALVRSSGPHGVLERLLHKPPGDAVVLAHRTFRPMFELSDMEAYAAQLQRAATHGNEGTLGCFVDTKQGEDGTVRVALYERWFDGQRLRCDELACRDFDATEPDAVASSAEFLTELQSWAADRNDQQELDYLEAAAQDRDRVERATERSDAARDLAQILASHNKPADRA